ncbi:hypothetical protein SAMN05421739_11711 [Pontibacter chinhatensis]|uniref:Uncharacterized protein n=1 Tax=Pontibacter chinhatensis TaxID=1436961 RepID=A0A1I2ZQE1_9BACT|nr:hypothetical protein SAMN05421739_11711 [Pontibacter chinhatensis]
MWTRYSLLSGGQQPPTGVFLNMYSYDLSFNRAGEGEFIEKRKIIFPKYNLLQTAPVNIDTFG